MQYYSSGAYSSLDAPFEEKAAYSWWWRLIALASSWMILAGFLSLPPLFEDKPELRTGIVTFTIVTSVLLTGGFALTALLYYSCPSWQYRLDVIFLPGFSSSSLGLLAILYDFAISSRYHWGTAAVVGTVIGIIATLTYLGLSILAHRRASSQRDPTSTQSTHLLRDLFPRRNRNRNPETSVSQEAPVQIIVGDVLTEEELTRQQMLTLLKQRDNVERRQSEASLRSTYNIEMPQTPRQLAADRLAMPQHVQEYYSPLNPNSTTGRRVDTSGNIVEGSQQSTLVPGSGAASGLETTGDDRAGSVDRRQLEIGRAESRERERSRSREIRRRQIEMGQT